MNRLKLYDVISDPVVRLVSLHPLAVVAAAALVILLVVVVLLLLRRRRKGRK